MSELCVRMVLFLGQNHLTQNTCSNENVDRTIFGIDIFSWYSPYAPHNLSIQCVCYLYLNLYKCLSINSTDAWHDHLQPHHNSRILFRMDNKVGEQK